MAWDSHTARSPSSITGTRPWGFNARNVGSLSLPKPPPAGMGSWAETEFADEPKHFLHIEGVAASPNLEHRRFLLMADAATPLRFLAGPAGFDGYNNAVERSRRRQLSNPVGTFLFSL